MHRLLKRQLKKACLDEQTLNRIQPFLDQVNDAYTAFDNDLYHVETILEKSSQELFQVNQQLKSNIEDVTSKLTRIADNIKGVIFEIDMDCNWTYLNSAWENLTGYPIEESIGKPIYSFFRDQNGQRVQELGNLKEQDFESTNAKFQILTRDNQLKWLDFSIKSIIGDEGQTVGYIGTIVDITRLKEIEADLILARQKAMDSNQAKDEFLSTMSHEIRTPLNAVVGISHLLLMENPNPAQIENLNALKFSAEHLLELVSDILDFNKISLGSIEFENIDFDLKTLLDGLQSIFRNKSEGKNISFLIKKDSRVPRMVKGDSTRLKQILANLINNAIKFTDEGRVVLDVELVAEGASSFTIQFKVMDTGIGIPEDKLDKIFESFSQANSDTTRLYGGTGLGLSISKKLLEGMHSELNVESTPGEGSTFGFSLRLEKSDLQERDVNLLSNYYSVGEAREDLHGVRVLIAEDNKMNVLVIKKFMTNWNIEFDLAYDGEMALEKAENNCYGLILMDLHMPKMDGFDASLAIRQSKNPLNRVVPIYALTASAGVDISDKIREYGMNGIISKPFDPKELHEKLVEIVRRNSLSESNPT